MSMVPPHHIKPLRDHRKAVIHRRRFGYDVHVSGLFIPEKSWYWRPTLKGARKVARRWVDGEAANPGLVVERLSA